MTKTSIKEVIYKQIPDYFYSFFKIEEKKLIKISKELFKKMDKFEEIPIRFTADNQLADTKNNNNLEQVLQNAKNIEKLLRKKSSNVAQKNADYLKNKIVSLLYRLEKEKKGGINKEHYKKIKARARTWKKNPLDERDKKMITRVCKYSFFTERTLVDKELLQDFFNWSIKDHNFPKHFIQYPAMCQKLIDCRLSERIGFYGGKQLKTEKALGEKHLTLLFQGKNISILDEKKMIKFKYGYCVSIKNIFKSFYNNRKEVGNFEMLSSGICNWNTKRFAYYDGKNYRSIDLDSENWWENLPVVEKTSKENAKTRYKVDLVKDEWIITLKATRESKTLSPKHTHSFLEIAIPTKNNSYKIYDFGKFMRIYPLTFFEYLATAIKTAPATICYPDENIFYAEREVIGYSALASHCEGAAIMQSIKKDIKRSLNGTLAFQFFIENCTDWAWKKINHHLGNERIPNFFDLKFIEIDCEGFLGDLFNFFRKLPPLILQKILTILLYLLGGWRGKMVAKKNGQKRWVSLLSNPPWNKDHIMRHPGMLFRYKSGLEAQESNT